MKLHRVARVEILGDGSVRIVSEFVTTDGKEIAVEAATLVEAKRKFREAAGEHGITDRGITYSVMIKE